MSRRTERVDELLRRELAQILIEGELRDPRLMPVAAIAITAVRVSADLSVARVFVDLLVSAAPPARESAGGAAAGARAAATRSAADGERVLAGLRASVGLMRAKLAARVRMRRVPTLSFFLDDAPERGARIETVLHEIAKQAGDQPQQVDAQPPGGSTEADPRSHLDLASTAARAAAAQDTSEVAKSEGPKQAAER